MFKPLLICAVLCATLPAAASTIPCDNGKPTGPVPLPTGCEAYYWLEPLADFPIGPVMDVIVQVPQGGGTLGLLQAFSFSPENSDLIPVRPVSFTLYINNVPTAWTDTPPGGWWYHNLRQQPLPEGDVSLKVFADYAGADVWADLRFGNALEAVPTPGSLAGMLGGFGVLAVVRTRRQRTARSRAQPT